MSVSYADRARFLTLGLLLLSFLSSISPIGNGQLLRNITSPTLQHDSLALTVNPDRSVGVGWNTTSTLPTGTTGSFFPASYTIHSSSSFSQQSNAVVQTSTVQYQLPPQLAGIINSISLRATQTGLTDEGSLTIRTNILPSSTTVTYSTTLSQIEVNVSSQLTFSPFLAGTPLNFLSSQNAFQANWTSTFGNPTWNNTVISQIQNATNHLVTVTTFTGAMTPISNTGANVFIRFVAQPTYSPFVIDFVSVLEKLLTSAGTPFPLGFDSIVRSALNLETGGSLTLTYSSATETLVLESTTNYVNNLDAQVNKLKDHYIQLLLPTVTQGTAAYASLLFFNSTSVTVSQISTTSDSDLSRGTSQMSLKGLLFNPPTVGSNTDFTIPGLFRTIGKVPAPGVNFTLVGGSNSTHSVRIMIPAGTPAPSSTTANSATWTNLRNATTLEAVRFTLVHPQTSLLDIILSPTGIAIEAIAAAAIAAGVIFYIRKRRATTPVPVTPPGPTPALGLGPSPTPPPP